MSELVGLGYLRHLQRQNLPPPRTFDEAAREAVDSGVGEILTTLAGLDIASPTDVRRLEEALRRAVLTLKGAIGNIPQTDLKPVLDAVAKIPRTDLSPVLTRIAEIPVPEVPVTDLSPVLDAIAALERKVDAIDVQMPEVTVNTPPPVAVVQEKPKEWVATVTARNAGGGIKTVRFKQVG